MQNGEHYELIYWAHKRKKRKTEEEKMNCKLTEILFVWNAVNELGILVFK